MQYEAGKAVSYVSACPLKGKLFPLTLGILMHLLLLENKNGNYKGILILKLLSGNRKALDKCFWEIVFLGLYWL